LQHTIPKKGLTIAGWKNLSNKYLYYQYFSANVIRGTKSKWKKWARVYGMCEREYNAY
jgi:hypothetical protein